MPEMSGRYEPGTPCWVDLLAADQQAAIDFYRDLFGWQGEVGPAEFGGYAVCSLKGKPVAGIVTAGAPEGQPVPPPVWNTYLSTDDADATQQAIIDAGGTVMMPVMQIGTVGRSLIAVDPTGAVFGVWQALDFPGAGIANEHGAQLWNELHTPDRPAAAAFYRAVFGAELVPMKDGGDYHTYDVKGRSVGGVANLHNDPPGTPAHWLTYFAAADTDAVTDRLVKHGGTALVPPFDMTAGRMAVLADAQGAVFAVLDPKPME